MDEAVLHRELERLPRAEGLGRGRQHLALAGARHLDGRGDVGTVERHGQGGVRCGRGAGQGERQKDTGKDARRRGEQAPEGTESRLHDAPDGMQIRCRTRRRSHRPTLCRPPNPLSNPSLGRVPALSRVRLRTLMGLPEGRQQPERERRKQDTCDPLVSRDPRPCGKANFLGHQPSNKSNQLHWTERLSIDWSLNTSFERL